MAIILDAEYLDWIRKNVCISNQYDIFRYTKLFHYLSSECFVAKIPMDNNRIADGNALKIRFARDTGSIDIDDRYFREWVNFSTCTVLDVMAALAIRTFEEVTGGFPDPINPPDIFWMMIENMHLETETDDDFSMMEVVRRIENMMYRRYDSDGDGGLFRIKGTDKNMREAEIWYQMQWWAVSVFEWYQKKGVSNAGLPHRINSID